MSEITLQMSGAKRTSQSLQIAVALEYSDQISKYTLIKDENTDKPVLKSTGGILQDSNAILWEIGHKSLKGWNDLENSEIYQWMEFSRNQVNIPLCTWACAEAKIRKVSKQDLSHAKECAKKIFTLLNDYFLTHTYLVGDRITIADIACASILYAPCQCIFDQNQQNNFENLTRWMNTMINQPQFLSVLGIKEASIFSQDTGDSKAPKVIKDTGDATESKEDKKKTPAQLKKEEQKRQKMEKFKAKQEKMAKMKGKTSDKKETKNKEPKKPAGSLEYTVSVPIGEKKDISGAMPDSYSPKYVEAVWYDWWEKMGYFKPEYNHDLNRIKDDSDIFMLCLPPPNVTGSLHLGHALTNTVEDALTRWNRMRGKVTLWSPGYDHAGIATQVVVEKKIWKEQKKTRHDLGRENFIKEVWKWKHEKGDRIYNQLKKHGASLDWDRTFFTMDDRCSRAVKETFVRLHDEGTIFRSKRLINWSCTLKSAISDIEVNKKELEGRTLLPVPGYEEKVEFGVIISFAYPIVGSTEELVVATTRIETMLGDTGIAVHPNDEKFKHLHGKTAMHPFRNCEIPIVCDEMVEMDFGTGAVKITPAHDPNDYECGKRHNLQFLNMISDTGDIMGTDTEFDGMKRFQARTAVLESLKKKGLYRETKDNPMVVPICSRSKDIVEPIIKAQWFVNCNEMAKKSVEAVKNKELIITPDMHEATWFKWLENIRDWCISRQLWWGHQIPAYFVSVDDPSIPKGHHTDGKYWVSGRDKEEALKKAAKKFNVCESKIQLEQDHDVLDTWFSSGLLPMSVHGWPDKTPDYNNFFPGTLLETGHDILFFWVARMVMFSLHLTGKLPFKTVYLHAMVRDAHGRKMSKSLGNVIDPLDVIYGITLEELHATLRAGNLDEKEIEKAIAGQKEDYPNGIPECGTDALRFALCAYTCQGRDINLDVLRIQGYRFFCNKLWNAFKFALRSLGETFVPRSTESIQANESPMDLWIRSKLCKTVSDCDMGFKTYEFPLITNSIFNFWQYELCDVYLEYLKPVIYGNDAAAKELSCNVLYTCLEVVMRLLHPVMPFVTEELWQRLPRRPDTPEKKTPPSVMVAEWPKPGDYNWKDDNLEKEVDIVLSIVKTARSLRADYNLTPKTKPELFIRCTDDGSIAKTITKFTLAVNTLSYSSNLKLIDGQQKHPAGCGIAVVSDKCDLGVQLKDIIDVKKELQKLDKNEAATLQKIKQLKEKISKPEYAAKVPLNVQKIEQEKLHQYTGEIDKIAQARKHLLSS